MASSCIYLSPFVTITLCSVAEHLISEVVHGFKFSHRAIVAYDRCSFLLYVCVCVCVYFVILISVPVTCMFS